MAGPAQASPAGRQAQLEDDDEYEYEYSTTETETYYLTLDLSLPDFIHRGVDDTPHNRRGGYSIWYNSAFNKADPNPPTTEYIEDDQDADDGVPAEREEDDEPEEGPQLEGGDEPSATENGTAEKDAETEELRNIQILELHSDRPIVSYRNRIMRGTWKRNMGTELILAAREAEDPLPALRGLAPGVDLLAASSARITFTEVDMVAREEVNHGAAMTDRANSMAVQDRLKRNNGVYVNVTSDKFGDRVPQACFLEDLTALKRKRGEMDEVTVVALDPPPNGASVEDEMHLRRHMRNVKSKQRYMKKKAEREAQLEAAIARGDAVPPTKWRASGNGKKPAENSAWFPRSTTDWAHPTINSSTPRSLREPARGESSRQGGS